MKLLKLLSLYVNKDLFIHYSVKTMFSFWNVYMEYIVGESIILFFINYTFIHMEGYMRSTIVDSIYTYNTTYGENIHAFCDPKMIKIKIMLWPFYSFYL